MQKNPPVKFMPVFVPLDRVESLALEVEEASQGGVALPEPEARDGKFPKPDARDT